MTTTDLILLSEQMAIPPDGIQSQLDQLQHRSNLITHWSKGGAIFQDARVLDIGCGQGDQTVALLGVEGIKEVIGADPASPDYGSPFTLGQAQAKLLSSPLFQGRLSFHRGTASQVLDLFSPSHFSTAILSHCLWYFPSEEAVKTTFVALREAKVKRVCVAEWSLSISQIEALPHLLAVLIQGVLKLDESANVRLPLSPKDIIRIAGEAGWTLSQQSILSSPKLKDGEWEVYAAQSVIKEYQSNIKHQDAGLDAHVDALESSLSRLESKNKVKTMEVWAGVFE